MEIVHLALNPTAVIKIIQGCTRDLSQFDDIFTANVKKNPFIPNQLVP